MTSSRLVRPTRRKNRYFTLEGNFLFMDAIQEMYMQSYGDKLRIFPTVPDSWKEASFRDLRAEGGFKVSASRVGGRTRKVEIEATCDSTLKLKDPFGGRKADWSRTYERKDGCLLFKLGAGETVKGKEQVLTRPPKTDPT